MRIDGTTPIDLTGLNKRDLWDINRSMKKERAKLEEQGFNEKETDCLMNAIYFALVDCKKENKVKYTPKKYRKQL